LGTAGQMAPEILAIDAAKPELKRGYFGQHVDVFNAGIILFNMIFQTMPFLNAVATDPFYKYVVLDQANNFWKAHQANQVPIDQVSSECKNLIFALLSRTPELRPTLLEALSHSWITQTQRMPLEQIPSHFAQRKAYKAEMEKKEKAQIKAKKAF
jgi:serine/threonine protein kinase